MHNDRVMEFFEGSYYLDRTTAGQAVEQVLPFISRAVVDYGVGDGGFLHIVIMNPGLLPHETSFENAILYEYSVGDRTAWDADYQRFARAKARIAWSTGQDSRLVQMLRPHLLSRGDTTLWGSAVLDGIVVATSGAQPWYDEAFAGMLAYWLKACVYARAQKRKPDMLFLT
jgi:hypothetical protein